ncbi:MAG: CDP-alcohol phosphatidyltransferase family protein [candidate division Zixibacteria bacterium]|nr:CDP-alcohol phosphatidyltransferase family protein [candidate division Zixibacteria bacterium]
MQQKKRVIYESVSIPYGRICLKLGLTPNVLTALSFVCAIGAGICFWQRWVLAGIIGMLLTAFTDMLDGATARAGGIGTLFGGILDHVSDRYGEAFILVGISLSGLVHPAWAIFALFGMVIASYTREAAEAIGKLDNVAVGAVGRMGKFTIVIIGSLLEYFLPDYNFLTYALIIVGLVSYVTSVQRLLYARKLLNARKDDT